MIKFIIIYILISIIIFFGFFCLTIYDFKKRNPYTIRFSDWYFDKWFMLNIICSLLWYIAIPIGLIIWCFTKVCKIIMKICKVE